MKRKKRKKNITFAFTKGWARVHVTTPAVYPVLLKAAAVGALSPSLNLQTPAFARETAALHPGRNPVFKAQMFIATFQLITTATVRQMGERFEQNVCVNSPLPRGYAARPCRRSLWLYPPCPLRAATMLHTYSVNVKWQEHQQTVNSQYLCVRCRPEESIFGSWGGKKNTQTGRHTEHNPANSTGQFILFLWISWDSHITVASSCTHWHSWPFVAWCRRLRKKFLTYFILFFLLLTPL